MVVRHSEMMAPVLFADIIDLDLKKSVTNDGLYVLCAIYLSPHPMRTIVRRLIYTHLVVIRWQYVGPYESLNIMGRQAPDRHYRYYELDI